MTELRTCGNRSTGWRVLSLGLSLWVALSVGERRPAQARNPFLGASSDDRVLSSFSGTEWGDELGQKDLPLSARVVTQRKAKLSWGEIFEISFESVRSQTGKPRSIGPLLLVVTDKEIVRIVSDKPSEAIEKLKALASPPKYEPAELVGLSQGQKTYKETPLTVAKIAIKGDKLRYTWNHNSGHYLVLEWQRGVGLIEISQNRGAHADGYRLRRGVIPTR